MITRHQKYNLIPTLRCTMDRIDIHQHKRGAQSWSPTQTVCVACVPHSQYWEPAKWVAKLRTYKTDANPLLLRCKMEAGHGGVSGRYKRYRETAFRYAFLLDLASSSEAVP
jgi:protease II